MHFTAQCMISKVIVDGQDGEPPIDGFLMMWPVSKLVRLETGEEKTETTVIVSLSKARVADVGYGPGKYFYQKRIGVGNSVIKVSHSRGGSISGLVTRAFTITEMDPANFILNKFTIHLNDSNEDKSLVKVIDNLVTQNYVPSFTDASDPALSGSQRPA